MKAVALTAVLLIFLAMGWTLRYSAPALAQTMGCCKERESFRAPWRKNGLSFESCKRLNDRRDRDDVSQEEGLVWWDRRCSGE